MLCPQKNFGIRKKKKIFIKKLWNDARTINLIQIFAKFWISLEKKLLLRLI